MPRKKQDWLIDVFYAAAKRRGAARDRVDPGWHHPSGMATPCLRQLQGKFIGMPIDNPVDEPVSIMGEIGNKLHEIGEDTIADERVKSVELALEEPSIPIRGHTDALVVDYDGVPAIVDWKGTISHPQGAKDGHKLQIAWYAYMAQVSRVIVAYIARGNASMSLQRMDWHEMHDVWDLSRRQAEIVTEGTLAGKIMPRTPVSRSQDCQKCPFLQSCDRLELIKKEDLWLQKIAEAQQIISGINRG